jgi:hypothetical protein
MAENNADARFLKGRLERLKSELDRDWQLLLDNEKHLLRIIEHGLSCEADIQFLKVCLTTVAKELSLRRAQHFESLKSIVENTTFDIDDVQVCSFSRQKDCLFFDIRPELEDEKAFICNHPYSSFERLCKENSCPLKKSPLLVKMCKKGK